MERYYNAKHCTVTVSNDSITGLAEDMIKCSKDEDYITTSVGAQGDVVVNVQNNPLGTIEITLQATSPDIETLYDYAKNGEVVSIRVKNTKTGETISGSKAMVKNAGETSYGAESGDRTFTFQVFDYTETHSNVNNTFTKGDTLAND